VPPDFFFGILREIPLNLLAVVVVVGKRVVDLGKRKVREPCHKFFRSQAVAQNVGHHRSDRESGIADNGTPSADRGVTGDMRMGDLRHAIVLTPHLRRKHTSSLVSSLARFTFEGPAPFL
jgi:hypothetical protein